MMPYERESLVEWMAEAMWCATLPHGDFSCAMPIIRDVYMKRARAALAVAEPVVREDAAKVLDARVAEIRADQAYWGGPDTTKGAVLIPELEARAAAIRARSTTAGEATP